MPDPKLRLIERTDEDLQRLAEIAPDDVTDASLWATRNDAMLGDLYEATEEDDD